MFEKAKISPSILSADFMNMQSSIALIEEGGAAYVHVDVMDGHFVPNLTIGVPFIKQLKRISKLPLDVHLMISNPLEQLPWFIEAGADVITVHVEALNEREDEIEKAISMIRSAGVRPGLTLKPSTPVSVLAPYINAIDMVLIMSVYPGFSGQSFIEGSELRVAELASLARSVSASPLIEVDGGIGPATIGCMAAAGADVFVAGNAVFASSDPKAAIKELVRLASDAQDERKGRSL